MAAYEQEAATKLARVQAEARRSLLIAGDRKPRTANEVAGLGCDQGVDMLAMIFADVDKNGDGSLTRTEMIKALNRKEDGGALGKALAGVLGLPSRVSGSEQRDLFELVFDFVDTDNTHCVDLPELRGFVADMHQFMVRMKNMKIESA